jgi:hypothetical protein
MAYQLPPMQLQQWRAPRTPGISLNYAPQQQQIGSPLNAENLKKWMLPINAVPEVAPAVAPVKRNPLEDELMRRVYLGGTGRSQQGAGGTGFAGSGHPGYGGYGGQGTRAGGVSSGGRGLW